MTLPAGQPSAQAHREIPAAGGGQRGYTLLVLSMLMLLNALNYLDRQIITVLAIPIKAELDLSNTDIGLMSGLAFAVFYALFGLPIAWWADRWNRVSILSMSLAIWSGMTALCGLTQNFAQLFAARVGVGIGEAGCTPPAHSLISDYVPREWRASALSFYALGIPIGSFLGLAIGGYVAQAWGWRSAFFVVGIPGVALALLLPLLVREPRAAGTRTAEPIPNLRQFLKDTASRPSYWHFCAACSLTSLLNFGSGFFLGFFFHVVHGLSLSELGLWLGIAMGIGWFVGISVGGALSDRVQARTGRGYATVPAWALLAGVPFSIAAYSVSNVAVAMMLVVVATALNSFVFGPGYAVVQGVAAPRSRAFAIALFLLVANLIGLGLGPVIAGGLIDVLMGYFSDQAGAVCQAVVAPTPQCHAVEVAARRWSLVLISLFALWSAAHLFAGGRTLRRDLVS